MLSKLMIALSIMVGAQAMDSTVSGTYQNIEVKRQLVDKGLLEFRFSSATYFSDSSDMSKKCDVLTIYLSRFNENKWENPTLRYFNYSQFKYVDDVAVRSNINGIDDKTYKSVMLDGGIKKLRDCYYLADAVSSIKYGAQTRNFHFGYIPVQSESPFWWKHDS
jgi:hypothetical protein